MNTATTLQRPQGMRSAGSGLLALGLAFWVGGCAPSSKTATGPPRIEEQIESLVANRGAGLQLVDTVGFAPGWKTLAEFYAERGHRPVWSNGRVLRRQAGQLVEAVKRTVEAGLDPDDYDLARLKGLFTVAGRSGLRADSLRTRNLARFDVMASFALLRVAEHLRVGRIPVAALDLDWIKEGTLESDAEGLTRSLGRDPSRLFASHEPRYEGYQRLREALARYREIAARGGWAGIPPGPPLELGSRGPRVAALVARLVSTEGFRPAGPDTVFDRRLQQAVGDYQTRLGVPRSGVVGEATRTALNVPVGRRIRQMELNLERWRWLPDTLGRRHVEINIPAYRLTLVRDGRVTRAMRVVVGKRRSPTPVFSDRIAYLEVNPTWTLPPSVVAKEIVPALKRNRDYLGQNRMWVISIADAKRDTVDPRDVPWKEAESDSFPYLIIKEAGPDNPLGRVKLMCPNEYDVYLHDSPQRSRFGVAVRDYSHGCVRLEHASELADSLLEYTLEDTVRVDSLAAKGAWKRVRLRDSVPVHFLYWTAWANERGQVSFRDDIYGLDERLDAALRARTTREFVLNPGVELSPFWAAEVRLQDRARGTATAASTRRR